MRPDHRRELWGYYDRRAEEYETGLLAGVEAAAGPIRAEAAELARCLAGLAPARFIDVGAGTGMFTGLLAGTGVALDQSQAMLRRLRAALPEVSVMRGDATALPVPTGACERLFAAHLYGHLDHADRAGFLVEAHRVAAEVVILDSGRPPGARPDQWQTRDLADASSYRIYKRHFTAAELADEVGGSIVFDGRYFVVVRCGP